MQWSALTHADRDARRVVAILKVLSKYGLADWLGHHDWAWLRGRLRSFDGAPLAHLPRAARVRLALTELGPTFIKLGQVLSTRGDLVGPELAAELGRLRANTPPDPPDAVRATIAAAFGRPAEAVFAELDGTALASGSIGQVHAARLPDGTAVVVKVQHAGILDRIHGDLEILALLAGWLEGHVPGARPYQPAAVAREFRRTLLQETDFTRERRHLETFARHFADAPGVHFPRVYPEACNARVLTMERLVGVSGEDVAGMRQAGADLPALARRGAALYLDMIFRDGFYHADPHPGNLLLLPGGVLGVLDAGMVGRLDAGLRAELEALLLAITREDDEELTAAVTRLGTVPPGLDRAALRRDVSALVADYAGQPLNEFDLSGALTRMTELLREYHVLLPPPCTLLLKTLVVLEGTAQQFDPRFSLAELLAQYQARVLRGRLAPARLAGRFGGAGRRWGRLLGALPGDLTDLLRQLRAGECEIRHRNRRQEAATNRVAQALVTGALLVASAELWARGAPPAVGGISVAGVAGFLAAAWMGRGVWQAAGRAGERAADR